MSSFSSAVNIDLRLEVHPQFILSKLAFSEPNGPKFIGKSFISHIIRFVHFVTTRIRNLLIRYTDNKSRFSSSSVQIEFSTSACTLENNWESLALV